MNNKLAVIVCNDAEYRKAFNLFGIRNSNAASAWPERQRNHPGPMVVGDSGGFMPVYDENGNEPYGIQYYVGWGYTVFPTISKLEEYIGTRSPTYRVLLPGETIKEGDEWFHARPRTWKTTASEGFKVKFSDAIVYRRKMEENNA